MFCLLVSILMLLSPDLKDLLLHPLLGAREIAHWLRVLIDLSEGQSSDPNLSQMPITPDSRDLLDSTGTCTRTYAYMHAYTHINEIIKLNI